MLTTPVTCPVCARENEPERLVCGHCGSHLPEASGPVEPEAVAARPGCVTAYALAIGIGGPILGLILITGAGGSPAALTAGVALAAYGVASAVGVWRLQNWGRLLVIVGLGLVFLGSIAAIVLAGGQEFGLRDVVLPGWGLGLFLAGYVVFWFVRNPQYFRR